jgi:hypothetical protein
MPNKREVKFVIFWSVFISILALLPLAYGHLNVPEGKVYTGLTASIYPSDVNSYFAWIRQAQEGSFLFEDKFTSEPHNAWIFHPVFLGIGLLSNISHINVIYFWYFATIASNFFLLYVVYLFLWNFFSPRKIAAFQAESFGKTKEKDGASGNLTMPRILSFIIITISSGFGWMLGQISADNWIIETSTFQSMRWPFIFSIAISLMLLTFLFLLKSEETRKIKFTCYAGFSALLLSIIHPYDMFVIIPVAMVFLLTNGWTKKELKKSLGKMLLFLALISPGILYSLYITFFDPVFGAHNKISMPSPSPLSYMLGFGLLSFFGFTGLVFSVLDARKIPREEKNKFFLIALWIIISAALLYSPVNFQRRFIMGLQIPLAIFSTIALIEITKKLKEKRKILAVSAAISFLSIGNFTFLLKDIGYLAGQDFPFFADKNFMAGLEWLDKNTKNQDVILSSPKTGNLIPRFSGNRVYIGHWAQTLDIAAKNEEVEKFYASAASKDYIRNFLEKSRVNYIFCGDFEYDCKSQSWEEKILALKEITLVFNSQSVKIYKVSNHN